jgi:hypothetical protein
LISHGEHGGKNCDDAIDCREGFSSIESAWKCGATNNNNKKEESHGRQAHACMHIMIHQAARPKLEKRELHCMALQELIVQDHEITNGTYELVYIPPEQAMQSACLRRELQQTRFSNVCHSKKNSLWLVMRQPSSMCHSGSQPLHTMPRAWRSVAVHATNHGTCTHSIRHSQLNVDGHCIHTLHHHHGRCQHCEGHSKQPNTRSMSWWCSRAG